MMAIGKHRSQYPIGVFDQLDGLEELDGLARSAPHRLLSRSSATFNNTRLPNLRISPIQNAKNAISEFRQFKMLKTLFQNFANPKF
jgi:hypothetical protein